MLHKNTRFRAGGLVDVGSQCLNDLDVVVLAEDGCARNKGISTRRGGVANVAGFYTAVYLQTDVTPTDIYDFSGLAEFVQTAGNKRSATEPGLTDIIKTRSTRSITSDNTSNGVAGLKTMPGFAPPSRIWLKLRCMCSVDSGWMVT